MSEKTGADRYFAERMKDPEYAKHYYEATISEQAARIEELEAERDDAKAGEDSWVAHYDRVAGYWEEAKAEIERLRAGADWAWTIIANAGWGDDAKTPGFEAVAEQWRDEFYYPMLRWPDG